MLHVFTRETRGRGSVFGRDFGHGAAAAAAAAARRPLWAACRR